MTGFVFATSACFGCTRLFSYNPHKVPSIDVGHGREPICQTCVDLINPKRIANGLDPIVPLPGAYEAMPEEEL